MWHIKAKSVFLNKPSGSFTLIFADTELFSVAAKVTLEKFLSNIASGISHYLPWQGKNVPIPLSPCHLFPRPKRNRKSRRPLQGIARQKNKASPPKQKGFMLYIFFFNKFFLFPRLFRAGVHVPVMSRPHQLDKGVCGRILDFNFSHGSPFLPA